MIQHDQPARLSGMSDSVCLATTLVQTLNDCSASLTKLEALVYDSQTRVLPLFTRIYSRL